MSLQVNFKKMGNNTLRSMAATVKSYARRGAYAMVSVSMLSSGSVYAYYCFSGGVYSGLTNLQTSRLEITYRSNARPGCTPSAVTVVYDCTGVFAGSPNNDVKLISNGFCMYV
jgi:hypothetical protein